MEERKKTTRCCQGLKRISLLFVLFLLVLCGAGAAENEIFRPGFLLLKPKAGRGSDVAALHTAAGARLVREFKSLGGIQSVKLPPGADVRKVMEKYLSSGAVEFAEPDYVIRVAAVPNEPAYAEGTLWHLRNTLVPGGDIHAAAGWDGTNSTEIIVAVVDSGIRYTHQDLASNMWVNTREVPGNGRDDDHNRITDDVYGMNAVDPLSITGDPNDEFRHGTRVAGIIGAVGDNGVGSCGVAWRVKLMACKFLDASGSGSVQGAIECLDYAIDKGAKVVNASFADSNYSAALYSAFVSCRNAGIIVAAASGNSGINCDVTPIYPASFNLDNIVSVAATTRYDALASYSNYGATNVDLGAPGSEIYSTWHRSDSDYGFDSGTSYAAPCVSGAIALMRARWPELTYRQIIDRLLFSVDPLPSLAGRCVSGGRLNLDKALNHWAPTLSVTLLTNPARVRLELQGEPSQNYAVQSSTNLVGWSSVGTFTTDASGAVWVTNNTSGSARFYRARFGP